MSIGEKLLQVYFDFAYNRVYDSTTARLNRYCELHDRCARILDPRTGNRVLCVGLGTGNELVHLLNVNDGIHIVGIDYSKRALTKAHQKASLLGKEVDLIQMNAQNLRFNDNSFDRVLCVHVTDFISDPFKVTTEIVRVLKQKGKFVITYPSQREGLTMGLDLLKDNRHRQQERLKRLLAILELIAYMVKGIVYLPLLLRPTKRSYAREDLNILMKALKVTHFDIGEDPVYRDFIVYGTK